MLYSPTCQGSLIVDSSPFVHAVLNDHCAIYGFRRQHKIHPVYYIVINPPFNRRFHTIS